MLEIIISFLKFKDLLMFLGFCLDDLGMSLVMVKKHVATHPKWQFMERNMIMNLMNTLW